MIAAYEAEMNVVIHAEGGGRLEAAVSDGQLDVDVVDRGPGIADVESAMREGWSTASAEARALGFGAGMGLPNILRNSDRLSVTSTAGEGTRVSFSVALRPEAADQGARPSSLGVVAELCKECRHCLVACPTAAIRVRDARPDVLDHLCIDCTACIGACAPRALTMMRRARRARRRRRARRPAGAARRLRRAPGERRRRGAPRPRATTRSSPCTATRTTCGDAVIDLAATGDAPAPLISPVCPAVINLVEVKFPSLLDHLAPLASPWEAAQLDLDGRAATFAVSCPSQRTALLAQRPTAQRDTVTAAPSREAVLPRLAARVTRAPRRRRRRRRRPAAPTTCWSSPACSHVLAVLEARRGRPAARRRRRSSRTSATAAASARRCCGEDAHVAAWRWAAVGGDAPAAAAAHERARPFRARPGIRLDADMAVAIRKLAQLDAETRALPGRDCGVCGAPTCAALAEDIVMERAARALCPYVALEEESAT